MDLLLWASAGCVASLLANLAAPEETRRTPMRDLVVAWCVALIVGPASQAWLQAEGGIGGSGGLLSTILAFISTLSLLLLMKLAARTLLH